MSEKNEITSNQSYFDNFVNQNFSQLTDGKLTIDKSKGTAIFSGTKDGQLYTISIEESELGQSKTETIYQELPRKSDYKDEVKRLRKQGLKQIEIALRLGISQSLVSKLSKE